MCGLVFLRGDNTAMGPEALLGISHRGRDSFHEEFVAEGGIENNVFLGHCRLAITGENGQQPIWNKEKTVACLVNGQFYNNKEEIDYDFSTDTDSEIALAFYLDGGASALEKLNGEFALVIWDKRSHEVIAMRDRFGVRPLRFFVSAKSLAIASEAKAFEKIKNIYLSEKSVLAALSVQYISPQTTFFEDIDQVAPGEMVRFNMGQENITFARKKWFRLFDKSSEKNSNNTKDSFIKALSQAVARRVDTDLPVAVHVSGGCDSTSVALLASSMKKNISAFCVEFEETDLGHNESAIAQKTCDILNIPLVRVAASRLDLVRAWPHALRAAEGFGINGHFAAKWLLAKSVHEKGFRVSLSGEGADEILLGYPFLQAEVLGVQSVSAQHIISQGSMLPLTRSQHEGIVRDAWGFVPIWLQAKLAFGDRLASFMKDDHRAQIRETIKAWAIATKDEFAGHHSPVHRAASSWSSLALGQYILPSLADAPEAFFHVQGRMPFLDADVVSAAENLSFGESGFPEHPKKILRDFLRDHCLDHVASRPKQPFDAPPLLGCSATRSYLKDLFLENASVDPLDGSAVKSFVKSWDDYKVLDCQHAEPVVCSILSLITAKNIWGK